MCQFRLKFRLFKAQKNEKTEKACDKERKVRKKESKRRKKRSRHSSTSSSEDASRHRSPRRKMLFSNVNPSVYSTYNHPAVDPFFSTGVHMPYMIPPYTGTLIQLGFLRRNNRFHLVM